MAAQNVQNVTSDFSVRAVSPIAFLIFLGFSIPLREARLLGQDRQNAPSDNGTLLLVRSWDAKSKELIGWLPTHRAAMKLKLLAGQQPEFDLNEAVSMTLPGGRPPEALHIAPEEELSYQGRRWLPVERERNLVRIGKSSFYVVSIDFGDSKWRRPTSREGTPAAPSFLEASNRR